MNEKISMTDEEIVIQTLKEQVFFGHIVDRYQEKLARYITRLGVRNPDDRDDVLQEIFVKVYKNLNGFDTSLSFSSWIYRIAHNEAISWYRKHSVRPEGHLVADSEELLVFLPSAETSNAEHLFDAEINASQLYQAIHSVPDRYRSVLVLRFFEHKEYEEISDILKIPIGTVGTLIHRGKQSLKKQLNRDTLSI